MIILDTNVVSEPTKLKPAPAVVRWFSLQDQRELFLTATSLAEIHVGLESLPNGQRKTLLQAGMVTLVERMFGPRILPFDEAAALAYGSLVPRMMAVRKKPSILDGQIAAIALVHGFSVATRDTTPFLAAGLQVINPWEA